MNIFFRVLLAIYAFCLALFSAFGMYVSFAPDAFISLSGNISDALSTDAAVALRVTVFAVSFVFFILSMMFLLSGVRSSKDKKAVSRFTNIGEIRISLNSIENIAGNVSRKTSGVKESRTTVRKFDDGVEIDVRMIVMPDIGIPALSEEVQGRVKKAVEDSAGIPVKNVRVLVDNIYSGIAYKARVE